jgi:hypothetical protein
MGGTESKPSSKFHFKQHNVVLFYSGEIAAYMFQ